MAVVASAPDKQILAMIFWIYLSPDSRVAIYSEKPFLWYVQEKTMVFSLLVFFFHVVIMRVKTSKLFTCWQQNQQFKLA